jgi:hypothetical protein
MKMKWVGIGSGGLFDDGDDVGAARGSQEYPVATKTLRMD